MLIGFEGQNTVPLLNGYIILGKLSNLLLGFKTYKMGREGNISINGLITGQIVESNFYHFNYVYTCVSL